MFQLSKYHKAIFPDEVATMFSQGLILSLRTGKIFSLKKGLYDMMLENAYEVFPNKLMLKFIDTEILVPKDLNEKKVLSQRSNYYDDLILICQKRQWKKYSEKYFDHLREIIANFQIRKLKFIIRAKDIADYNDLNQVLKRYQLFCQEQEQYISFSFVVLIEENLVQTLDLLEHTSFVQNPTAFKIIFKKNTAIDQLPSISKLAKKATVQLLFTAAIKPTKQLLHQLQMLGLNNANFSAQFDDQDDLQLFLTNLSYTKKSQVAANFTGIKNWKEGSIIIDEQEVEHFLTKTLNPTCRACEFQFICGGFLTGQTVECPSYALSLQKKCFS
ncbi:MAG: hypothetical protein AB8G15_04010 [Saprospiraceae bacterium]